MTTTVYVGSVREALVKLLTCHRWSLSDEKVLQAEIADVLTAAKLDFRREVHLGPRDIVDFVVGEGIAVEVKIKGERRAIFRQLTRYCHYDAVGEILLATNVPMNLPDLIEGKPASIAALGRGWL